MGFCDLPVTEAEGYDCGMNLGISEMIFLFIAALILVGPKKLPEIMRQVGKFMAEFKRASNEFKWQIETEMRNLDMETERGKQTILPPATPVVGTIANGAVEAKPALTDGVGMNGAPTNGSGGDASSSTTAEPASSEHASSDPISSEPISSEHAPSESAAAKSVDV